MYAVTRPLETTCRDDQIMEKRFHALSHLHNVMVKHAKKLLKKLKYDKHYQACLQEYTALCGKAEAASKNKPAFLSAEESERLGTLKDELNAVRKTYGLSDAGFQSYLKVSGKQFKKCLSSQQIQKEASRVWEGASKVLFGDGKQIHFKNILILTR